MCCGIRLSACLLQHTLSGLGSPFIGGKNVGGTLRETFLGFSFQGNANFDSGLLCIVHSSWDGFSLTSRCYSVISTLCRYFDLSSCLVANTAHHHLCGPPLLSSPLPALPSLRLPLPIFPPGCWLLGSLVHNGKLECRPEASGMTDA